MLNPKIDDLTEESVFTIVLTSLGHPEITLRKPITITIERDGEEYVASFLDANIGSGGPTLPLAVSNLQDMILDLYEMHEQNVQRKLGPMMKKQKNVLMEVVCRDSQKSTPKNP